MSLILIFFVTLQVISHVTDGKHTPFFRKDYFYISETRSFYKMHTLQRTWESAKQRCEMEGTQLFYAEDEIEANLVLNHWRRTQVFPWIFIGLRNRKGFKGNFETIDGKPMDEVYIKWGKGEPNDADGDEDCLIMRSDGTLNDDKCYRRCPFICKKTYDTVQWNSLCEMPDMAYLFNSNLGKCYKIHLTPNNWTEAYDICRAEQSYLAIVNSEAEKDFIVKIIDEAPKDKVPGSRSDFNRDVVHLGFENRDKEGWRTIRGVPLKETGYTKWADGQPDGDDKEQCGSMFYNGDLNDFTCDSRAFFVCEHDVDWFMTSVDERFGKS